MSEKKLEIKVCGMTQEANIAEVSSLLPDYLGFILFDRSPRCCRGMDPGLPDSLPSGVQPVLVTVDMPVEELVSEARSLGIRTLQLHGSESPETCRRLKAAGFTIWKAVPVSSTSDFAALERYAGTVDRFLFDTSSPLRGGSGRKFDWSLLDSYSLSVPFMLSGGIGPDDAGSISELRHPMLAGIDVNSRFETAPGVKDAALIKSFIEKIRNNE